MSLRYCFEQDYVIKTLDKSMKDDLAVIDPDGIDPIHIRRAVGRGVHVYGYLNAGALEKERSYYNEFDDLSDLLNTMGGLASIGWTSRRTNGRNT